jgi:hypothetical protein
VSCECFENKFVASKILKGEIRVLNKMRVFSIKDWCFKTCIQLVG